VRESERGFAKIHTSGQPSVTEAGGKRKEVCSDQSPLFCFHTLSIRMYLLLTAGHYLRLGFCFVKHLDLASGG